MEFAGMAVAHLAMDPKKLIKSGRILLTSDLAREYGYQDFDGSIHDMLSIRELLNANVIRFFFFLSKKYLPNYFSWQLSIFTFRDTLGWELLFQDLSGFHYG